MSPKFNDKSSYKRQKRRRFRYKKERKAPSF